MALDFDLEKTFDQNIAEFRKGLEGLDPECTKIFFNNLTTLLGDGNPDQGRTNRTAFNEAVLAQLKNLLPKLEAQ